MKLSAALLKKFESSPISVRMVNGTHKRATVRFAHAAGGYELSVERTHPLMKEFRFNEDRNTLTVYDSRSMNNGIVDGVPQALSHVVQRLFDAAATPDEQARDQISRLEALYVHSMFELGFSLVE